MDFIDAVLRMFGRIGCRVVGGDISLGSEKFFSFEAVEICALNWWDFGGYRLELYGLVTLVVLVFTVYLVRWLLTSSKGE